ncbi:MAG: hypothetical protein K2W96_01475, partial [Gemmataceae bacterium]|nr:hypothetical protein [Gemmataceae bacterium]
MPQLRRDSAAPLLELAQSLLAGGSSPADALPSLARAAGGTGAGLARCGPWSPVFSSPHDLARPWEADPSLASRLGEQAGPLRLPDGGMAALAPSLDGAP